MPLNILRLTILLLGTSNRLQTLTSRSCVCGSILNDIKTFAKILYGEQDSALISMSLTLSEMFRVFSGVSGLITQQK